jgi:hypothetical protein
MHSKAVPWMYSKAASYGKAAVYCRIGSSPHQRRRTYAFIASKEAGDKPAFGGYASSRLGEVRHVYA